MQKKIISFVIAIGLIVLSNSCTKKGDTGPTGPAGPAGPAYTGAISGHLSLYDQYGIKVLSGYNSAQIQLDGGTAISPDNTGYYIFGSLTTGNYTLVATDNGYATTKANSFQFLDDTLNKDIKLSAIPSFSPTSMNSYQAISSPADSLVINFAADTRARNCIVFINNNTTVGNLPANYLQVYTKAIAANQTRISVVIPSSDLADAGIASGATYYCAAYGYVVGDVSVYEDLATGKNVYNAVSASPVTVTAVAP